eukprot:CAMPEP_0181237934 /NCGR_PEP_ID=MMETSP1096-20121128/39045_1 /TAXON_ID=156174 ORGANISM="Chrysochromulina ericina, Strain CCMP281" /NCGR_SAMPLE_ID=MMETSP1096 /ASSEMBLY_ACC=CAM_ASM_000453 /LENGTH=88 /DNA_ID=CAMNT_0023333357 /DNA_START=299 /DNA_END=562 /DNA_ORIENTATION=-
MAQHVNQLRQLRPSHAGEAREAAPRRIESGRVVGCGRNQVDARFRVAEQIRSAAKRRDVVQHLPHTVSGRERAHRLCRDAIVKRGLLQ